MIIFKDLKKTKLSSKLLASKSLALVVLSTSLMLSTTFSFAQTADDQAAVQLATANTGAEPTTEAAVDAIDPAREMLLSVLADFKSDGQDSLDKNDRAGIAEYYTHNDYAPIWTVNGNLSKQARATVFLISRASRYGLDASDYELPSLAPNANGTAIDNLNLDLSMSLAATRFARHLSSGRLVPQKVSSNLDINPERIDPSLIIQNIAKAKTPNDVILEFQPKHPQYIALLKQLENLAAEKVEKQIVIPKGRMLKPGMSDPRVPLLRARLKVAIEELEETPIEAEGNDTVAAAVDENLYDEGLIVAVKAFQKENRLSQDGILGPNTLRVMNGDSKVNRRHQLIVNLERWRWMPKELGQFHIFANIPEYRVFVNDGEKLVHTTRVVVGKAKHATVAFSDEMETVVVNPSWGVPQSIIKNEMLPAARANRGYFNAKGYQVFARIRGKTRRVDPSRVNWNLVNPREISVRQPPGARNALGRIKFLFPNKHAIYMHDTPSKSLFNRDRRAFSHGCVRIHNPMEFAEAVMTHEAKWNAARLQGMVGGKERQVKLQNKIPVHLAYFTAKMSDDGDIIYFEDIYGHDRRMVKALGLS